MTQIEKYIWLIGKLKTFSSGLTLQELSDAWELKMAGESRLKGESLDRQTLGRWRKNIYEAFDINIISKRVGSGRYIYKIDNPDKIDGKNVESWVINSLSIFNTLNAYRQLDDRIVSDLVPKGTEHLQSILEAMSASCAIHIAIRNFNDAQY